MRKLLGLFPDYIQQDTAYLSRNWSWLIASHIALGLAGFLLVLAFARLAPAELFGQYQFFIALLGTLAVLAMPGLNISLTRSVMDGKEGTFWLVARKKLLYALLGSVALVVSAAYFYFLRGSELWVTALLASLLFPVLYTFDIVHSYFIGKEQFRRTAIAQMVVEIVPVLATATTLLFSQDIVVLLMVYLVLRTITLLIVVHHIWREAGSGVDAEAVPYGIQLSWINFLSYAKAFVDKVIVAYFLGFIATAVYAIATVVPEQFYAIGKQMSSFVFVKAGGKRAGVVAAFKKRFIYMMLFFSVLTIIGVLLLPYFITVFFGDKYAQAVLIAQLLMLVSIPRIIALLNIKVLEAQKEPRKLAVLNSIGGGIEIALMLILAPFLGLFGIVIGKAAGNLYLAIASFTQL